MIKVLFFAQIRERLNCDVLELQDVPETLMALRQTLSKNSELWAEMLQSKSAIAAVNQTIASDDIKLNKGDEIAFFPPVTGG